MRFTFRAKLLTIVGTAALAFLVLIVASALIADRTEQQLTKIRDRYLPKVELRPQLEGQFERIARGLQDAVAAHDAQALTATRELKNSFLQQLAAAREAVDATQAAALQSAIDDYYAVAYDVSRRLISGETGEELVDAMTTMQTKHARATELLKKTTAFDKGELAQAFSAAAQALVAAGRVRLFISAVCLVSVILLSMWLSRGALRSLGHLTVGLRRFGGSDFSQPILVSSRDEFGDVAAQANQMGESLKRLGAERDRTDWLKGGYAGLAHELRGELEPAQVASRAIGFLARYLDARAAALYYSDQDGLLRLLGQYAHSNPGSEIGAKPSFRRGEGLVGQASLQDEMMVIADPPPDYLRVRSGLGEGTPRVIALLPLMHLGKVTGVLEIALFKPWSELATELLLSVRETLALAIEVARARTATRELLAATQRQAQRLEAQEEELRASNEELRAQQDELRQTNEELRQQTEELEVQRRILEEKNAELDDARRHLEQKAQELATVSAYKSQFLANMSHELRTPLNSMLLLSNLLAENEAGNLTDKQVQFSKTINSAGRDLLALINQVLDLAKVEAGKQEVRIEPVALHQLSEHAKRVFEPLARDKGLGFVVDVAAGLPETIATDSQRLQQILNNLLGNAIKFTERGEVALRIGKPEPGLRFHGNGLQADRTVAFAVSDTGVGIATEHQERIFVPFEQVEAASDRRYGGTGLGLSIARELASLLGGELQLRSTPGHGSTFVCYLPYEGPVATEVRTPALQAPPPSGASVHPATATAPATSAISDGRTAIQRGDTYLLIIEDDPVFAETFSGVIQGQGLKYFVASDGQMGLRMAKEQKPAGIILDVKLPDVDGWTVMDKLRADPLTADIPVHFVSGVEAAERGMASGAVGYLTKPVTRADLVQVVDSLVPNRSSRSCRILLVEDDIPTGDSLLKQLTGENLEVLRVTSARDALEALNDGQFGCMILDLSLPDMDGLELLQSLQEESGPERPSVVVYTARALSKAETKRLEAYTEAIVLKEGPSAERLLNEVRLFVRRLKEGMGSKRQAAARVRSPQIRLDGRKVLVVDDDMRTVYALSATLRAKGAKVLVADTGQSALSVLAEHPDVGAVLMDIMMPEMDGYEAIRRIRQDARFRQLLIIALTAKAMKGDKEKCLEAGASDYLPKPVDAERLLAMLQSHLSSSPTDGD